MSGVGDIKPHTQWRQRRSGKVVKVMSVMEWCNIIAFKYVESGANYSLGGEVFLKQFEPLSAAI